MKKKAWITTTALVVLAVAVAVSWAIWGRTDPDVERVKRLGEQMFSEEGRNMDPDQRREMFEQMRAARENLSEEQRRELGREMRERFAARMNDHISEYFALPPTEQVAFLDQDIDRMEEMRQRFQAMRNERGGADRAGRGGPPGGSNASQRAGGPQGRAGGGPGDRGRGRPRTEQERRERQLRRLDHTTPEQRAKMEAYREAINKRRAERGLEPLGRGPWGGGGRGGPGR